MAPKRKNRLGVPEIEEFKPVYTNKSTLLGMSETGYATARKKVVDEWNRRKLTEFAAKNWDAEDDPKWRDPKNVYQAVRAARESVTKGTLKKPSSLRDERFGFTYHMNINKDKAPMRKVPSTKPDNPLDALRGIVRNKPEKQMPPNTPATIQPHQLEDKDETEKEARVTKVFGRGRR